jgi:uncharacterized protein
VSPARKKRAPSGLAGRLKRLQEHTATGGATKSPPVARGVIDKVQVERLPPGWERLGDFIWRRSTSVSSVCPSELPPSPLNPDGAALDDMVFIDIETTGLSGGAGTVAFLIGIGERQGSEFRVEQLFLRDYPGEPDLLTILLDRFRDDAIYVSYNGKSFDTQILKTRFVMNGMRINFVRQLDLLHPSRRLWSSMLDSCSLGSIEEHILGVSRELDVPGIMVPEIYFDFLRTGDTEALAGVFAHHLEDIISLERLLAHLHRVLSAPQDAMADHYQLGRWFLRTGFTGGEALLRNALTQGNPRAGYVLGSHLRRQGDLKAAAALWEGMFDRWRDRFAALELAKYHEHRLRDFEGAERYVNHLIATVGALDRAPRIENEAKLLHRLNRIGRKAGRSDTSS